MNYKVAQCAGTMQGCHFGDVHASQLLEACALLEDRDDIFSSVYPTLSSIYGPYSPARPALALESSQDRTSSLTPALFPVQPSPPCMPVTLQFQVTIYHLSTLRGVSLLNPEVPPGPEEVGIYHTPLLGPYRDRQWARCLTWLISFIPQDISTRYL